MECKLCSGSRLVWIIKPMSQPPRRVSGPCECLYPQTNRAFVGAWLKGWRGAEAGETLRANPYDFWDMHGCNITFARAFHRFWNEGYAKYAELNAPNATPANQLRIVAGFPLRSAAPTPEGE